MTLISAERQPLRFDLCREGALDVALHRFLQGATWIFAATVFGERADLMHYA